MWTNGATTAVQLIPEYSHDESNKAKKFIITHQFTQPTDFEYQTSVQGSNFGAFLGQLPHFSILFFFHGWLIFPGKLMCLYPSFLYGLSPPKSFIKKFLLVKKVMAVSKQGTSGAIYILSTWF